MEIDHLTFTTADLLWGSAEARERQHIACLTTNSDSKTGEKAA